MRLFENGVTASAIASHLPFEARLVGDQNAIAYNVNSIFEATPDSLTWVRDDLQGGAQLIAESPARIIICGRAGQQTEAQPSGRCLIVVDNPQHAFLRVLNDLIPRDKSEQPGIHPTSIVAPTAELADDVCIGPFTILERCTIGAGSVIGPHTVIGGGTVIGECVRIREHCTIGGTGFGHIRNERNELENMTHVGNVRIEDRAELFPFVNVDRATLGTTVVSRAAKIDHYCHIGHNSYVGESSVITARTTLAGGARVGHDSWIGIHCAIRDRISIGNNCLLGMASVVTRDVPDGESWAGAPARPMEEFRRLQQMLRQLAR